MTMGITNGYRVWTIIAAIMGPCCALADTAPTPGGQLEEITVTAQKRAESQQNVPMSITTFGAVALEQKNISDFFDYATKVPNLVRESAANSRDRVQAVVLVIFASQQRH
jgi:hypothetical protein